MTDKATTSPASVDKQAALVAKLRYMGKQYAAGQVARGGAPQKHYLEEAADEIEMMAWALSMNKVTPASAQENAALRNVIQAACIDGLPGLSRAWEKYFPDRPITIKGAEVERLAAQAAPTDAYERTTQPSLATDYEAHQKNGLAWAVNSWMLEVKNRPLINVHRRTLDDTWRQVIRYFGGNPEKLIGPSHDALMSKGE